MAADEDRIRGIIRSSAWLMGVLRAVRQAGLPDAWVGAGVLRDLVWGELYGPGFTPGEVHDVDVAFFDPADKSRRRDEQATARLLAAGPGIPWQARNQAAVHTWYSGKFGGEPVAPLLSVADAVATWPETATAVAVRLEPRGADRDRDMRPARPGRPAGRRLAPQRPPRQPRGQPGPAGPPPARPAVAGSAGHPAVLTAGPAGSYS